MSTKTTHQHENWQLRKSPSGVIYCAACGQDITSTPTPAPVCFLCGKPGPATGIQVAGADRILIQEILTMASDQELAGIKAGAHPGCWDAADWLD